VVPTATKRILLRRIPGTCETVGQLFKCVWRLCLKINVVCMSLSPFHSFQSRFVTYLLNRPRTRQTKPFLINRWQNPSMSHKRFLFHCPDKLLRVMNATDVGIQKVGNNHMQNNNILIVKMHNTSIHIFL